MSDRVYHVLFLCTGNSARSIIGEAAMNHLGDPHFRAYSAGSAPKAQVHPLTLEVLADAGIATGGLRSKSWDVFAAPDARTWTLFLPSVMTLPAKPAPSGRDTP